MSDCHPEALEGYAAGTLDEAEATAVAVHLSSCAACAEELRWLERERRLFIARAQVLPGPASFERLLSALGEDASPAVEAIATRAVEAIPAPTTESTAARALRPARKRSAKTMAARGRRSKDRPSRWLTAPVVRAILAAAALACAVAALTLLRAPDPQVGAEPVASAPDVPQPVAPAPTAQRMVPPPSPAGDPAFVCSPEAMPAMEHDCAGCGSEELPMPEDCPNSPCVTCGDCGPQR